MEQREKFHNKNKFPGQHRQSQDYPWNFWIRPCSMSPVQQARWTFKNIILTPTKSQNNPPLQLVFKIQHLQTDWPQISIIWLLAGATVKAVLVITGGPLLAAEPCPSVETGTLWSHITQSAGSTVQTLVHTAQRLYTSTADGAFPLFRAPVTKVAFIILASHIYFLSF